MNILSKTVALLKGRSKLPGFKSFSRQLFEIIVLFTLRGIGPGYYHLAEMGRKDRGWDYLFGFARAPEYHRAVNRINDPLFRKLSQHKALEKAVLTAYGIPTTPLLGHLHPQNGLTTKGEGLKDAAALSMLLANHLGEIICFKPVEGVGGSGFKACMISEKSGDITLKNLKDGAVFLVPEFLEAITWDIGMVIESYVEQHAELAKFHPTSVNTMRVLVLRGANGKAGVVGSTFRIGCGGSVVDNATAGGIMAHVNTETGVMNAGVFMEPSLNHFACHPDTNVPLEGAVLPFFDEMQDLACRALDAYPHIGFVGADVAYTKSGPMIIEMNPEPDYVFMAINQLGSRKLLGV